MDRLLEVYSTARYGHLALLKGIGIGSFCLPSPQYKVYTSNRISSAAPDGVRTWSVRAREVNWMYADGGSRFPVLQKASLTSFRYIL